jgi:predicted Zn-dependent peptidase
MNQKIIKYQLPNGLRVILVPQKSASSVTVLVGIGTGSKNESEENSGISHFLEHMFFKGTKKRPSPKDIARVIDSVGGEQNAFTSKEMTGFWVKVDKKHLKLGLDLMADMLFNSKFLSTALTREKGVIIEEINLYQDTPIYYIHDLFEKLLYGNQPAGRLIIGSKENISKMQRSDFLSYLHQYYLASNTVVAIAGNFQQVAARELVKRFFTQAKTGKLPSRLIVQEKQKKPEILLHYKKTDQTHLCLGVRAGNIFDKNKYAVKILATILGGNMSSRLFLHLREKAGLAYYVKTSAEINPDTGYLVTQAGVPNNQVIRAVSIIVGEYKKIKSQLTQTDLKRAKDYLSGTMLLALESSDELAGYYLGQELLENKTLAPEEVSRLINRVTLSDLVKVAREIFVNQKLNLALIGPFRDKKAFIRVLGW